MEASASSEAVNLESSPAWGRRLIPKPYLGTVDGDSVPDSWGGELGRLSLRVLFCSTDALSLADVLP